VAWARQAGRGALRSRRPHRVGGPSVVARRLRRRELAPPPPRAAPGQDAAHQPEWRREHSSQSAGDAAAPAHCIPLCLVGSVATSYRFLRGGASLHAWHSNQPPLSLPPDRSSSHRGHPQCSYPCKPARARSGFGLPPESVACRPWRKRRGLPAQLRIMPRGGSRLRRFGAKRAVDGSFVVVVHRHPPDVEMLARVGVDRSECDVGRSAR
jgi:hypothetical protein